MVGDLDRRVANKWNVRRRSESKGFVSAPCKRHGEAAEVKRLQREAVSGANRAAALDLKFTNYSPTLLFDGRGRGGKAYSSVE